MMFLVASQAEASACCVSGSAQPSILAPCDRLGIGVGLGGGVETGGWTSRGTWFPAGDDGGGNAGMSLAFLGRFAQWAQGGLRVPVSLIVDRVDGATIADFGLGSGLWWIDFETPPEWTGGGWPWLALELGLGTATDGVTAERAKVAQVTLRADTGPGRLHAWGSVEGRWPILGEVSPDTSALLAVDHETGRARFGLAASPRYVAGQVSAYDLAVGPTVAVSTIASNRVLGTLLVSVPAPSFGQSTTSQVRLSVEWIHVVEHDVPRS